MILRSEPASTGSHFLLYSLFAMLFGVLFIGSQLFSPSPAHATTYILVPDAALARQADLIVEGRIRGGDPATDAAAIDYQVAIETPFVGRSDASTITVRVDGGPTPDGSGDHVIYPDAPRFAAGERVLLLLTEQAGKYRILHINQGLFRVVRHQGRDLILRDLYSSTRLDQEGKEHTAPDTVRDLQRFGEWLALTAKRAPEASNVDYRVSDVDRDQLEQLRPRFNLIPIGDIDRGVYGRWLEFDSGGSLAFHAHSQPQEGFNGDLYGDFRTALAAWTGAAGSAVKLTYAGTTGSAAGLRTNDQLNTVLFNDLAGDINSSFTCKDGGVLARAVIYARAELHAHRGVQFRSLHETDIAFNKDISCWLNGGANRASQLFGHELGHSLGLLHTCGGRSGWTCETEYQNQALMRGFAHDDARGAALAKADRDGACFLYGNCADTLNPPLRLRAQSLNQNEILFTWEDQSDNETGFQIELGIGFQQVMPVLRTPANVEQAVLRHELEPNGPGSGSVYSFYIRAFSATSVSPVISRETVAIPPPPPPEPPSELTATAVGLQTIRFNWKDNSDNEIGFRLYDRIPGSEHFTGLPKLSPANSTERIQYYPYNPANGRVYEFRLSAEYEYGSQSRSKVVRVTMPRPGPAAAPTSLIAVPTATDTIRLSWIDNADNEAATEIFASVDGAPFEKIGTAGPDETRFDASGLVPGADYRFQARTVSFSDHLSNLTEVARATIPTAGSPCVEATDGCLLGGRFRVQLAWRNQRNGEVGQGMPAVLTDQSSTFWFFQADNTESIVKMVDGRGNNGHFWFFYGGLSDVEYWVTVSDTETGAIKTYRNAPGDVCGLADTRAFAADAGAGFAPLSHDAPTKDTSAQMTLETGGLLSRDGGACGGGAGSLCLLDDRLRVDVSFAAPNGQAGVATPLVAPQSSERTGLFWFFQQSNPELVVKAIDGTANNGHIWIFWGALTNVAYEITVTDTVTGASKTYKNEQGNVCGGADVRAL